MIILAIVICCHLVDVNDVPKFTTAACNLRFDAFKQKSKNKPFIHFMCRDVYLTLLLYLQNKNCQLRVDELNEAPLMSLLNYNIISSWHALQCTI